MKKWYVYELYNLAGTVEYVGESCNIKNRFSYHKCKVGKFYGRTDISMNIVKEFNNKKDAYNYQCQLQKEYGLITDSEIYSKAHSGRTQSAEHRRKISEAAKSRTHSDETKQKMKEAAIRRYSTTNV